MTMGVQVFNSSGNLVWDSRTVAGAVIADNCTYTSGQSATLTYPDFSGRSVDIVFLDWNGTNSGITTDTTLGYPRVTVPSKTFTRRFLVICY